MKNILTLTLVILLSACGGDSDESETDNTTGTGDTTDTGDTGNTDDTGSTTSVSSESFPSTLAVSSPFEQSGSSASFQHRATSAVSSDGTAADKQAFYAEILAAATDAACEVFLPSVSQVNGPSCYGPDLDYINHVNAFSGSTDSDSDVTMSSGPGPSSDDDGRLPTGDLGIWSASETDGEACSAAKINSLVEDVATKVDYAMTVAAAMSCVVARSDDLDLPEADATTTITSALSTALAVNNSGLTVTLATISAATDSDSNTVYTYDISTESDDATSVFTIKHVDQSTDTDEDGTVDSDEQVYAGKIWGSIEGMGAVGGSGGYGFSMLYNVDGAATSPIKFKLVSGAYSPDGDDPNSTDYFDSNGDYITMGEGLGNLIYAVANIDLETGLGSLVYSWSAGGGNEESRTFNAMVTSVDSVTTGYGFFGYGDVFNTSDGSQPDGSINEFICNWAGPGNSHEGVANTAQKQVMTLNTTDGVFESTSASITYAPTVSCDFDGSSTNESGGVFDWGLAVSDGPNDFSEFGVNFDGGTTDAHTATSNDLVDLESDSDYLDIYVAPTEPTDPFLSSE
ncbi:MAG: hypothetical protein KUG82_01165 [Pseudomonadales bacterium]|nr:hypothetical protein [Pseudomonadales bacterium]